MEYLLALILAVLITLVIFILSMFRTQLNFLDRIREDTSPLKSNLEFLQSYVKTNNSQLSRIYFKQNRLLEDNETLSDLIKENLKWLKGIHYNQNIDDDLFNPPEFEFILDLNKVEKEDLLYTITSTLEEYHPKNYGTISVKINPVLFYESEKGVLNPIKHG